MTADQQRQEAGLMPAGELIRHRSTRSEPNYRRLFGCGSIVAMTETCSTESSRRRFLASAVWAGAATATLPVIAHSSQRDTPATATNVDIHPQTFSSGNGTMPELINAASKLPRLQSLVVLGEGKPLVTEAFSIADVYTPVNIKSVSKSILSALTGIALERGVFDSVNQTLDELAPALIPDHADRPGTHRRTELRSLGGQ